MLRQIVKMRVIGFYLMFLICFKSLPAKSQLAPIAPIEPSLDPVDIMALRSSLVLNECRVTISETTLNGSNNDIILPQNIGHYVEDCARNKTDINQACIYPPNPLIRDGSLLSELVDIFEASLYRDDVLIIPFEGNTDIKENFAEIIQSTQNYAVSITGNTTPPIWFPFDSFFLKNNHYEVIDVLNVLDILDTPPFLIQNFDFTKLRDYLLGQAGIEDFSVELQTVYYYLMYQKEWMELNAGGWWASNKNIKVNINDPYRISSSWNFRDITFVPQKLSVFLSDGTYINDIIIPFNAHVIAHEAAHANFSFSNPERFNKDYQDNFNPSQPSSFLYRIRSCADGCYMAIDEGQANFSSFIVFPDIPFSVNPEAFIKTEISKLRCEDIQSPLFDDLGNCYLKSNPRYNRGLTMDHARFCNGNFEESLDNIHRREHYNNSLIYNMAVLYTSIWWELYNHPETSKRDIATLFSEHLPLVSRNDNFRRLGSKIVVKARDLFNGLKGEQYACIIAEEFEKRGLKLYSDDRNPCLNLSL